MGKDVILNQIFSKKENVFTCAQNGGTLSLVRFLTLDQKLHRSAQEQTFLEDKQKEQKQLMGHF